MKAQDGTTTDWTVKWTYGGKVNYGEGFEYFLKKFCPQGPGKTLSQDTAALLSGYHWPGNVRELQECLLRAAAGSTDGLLHLEALPPSPPSAAPRPVLPADDNAIVFTEAEMQALERINIANALQRCHGKIYGEDGAAALLGISPTTLCSRIKKFGLRKQDA